ncbi:S8 family serine peptidase [Litorilinea aerophila]|uniref:S8 family peptidase n=1 Tax=Litorilinea aerophila TaxID=1204385 RepID=UPI0014776B26|nr:S8 family serine peptidase [Litorilinea aerophila]MCC9078005.1 S8 family serine peptidase [Litorilinea aerophila]
MKRLPWAVVLMAVLAFALWHGLSPRAVSAARVPHFVHVMVELAEPPAAALYAGLTAAGPQDTASLATATRTHLASLEAAQIRLLEQLAGLDAQVLYRIQRVYNGVALRVDAAQLDALAALPGVKAVHPLVPKTPLGSIDYIGAPQLWQGVDGQPLTGRGIRIAVIDTGIDYLHPHFGGPGTGYGSNDPTAIGDVAGFPGAKVVGGYDFAGDTYNADPESAAYQPIPEPDPDPMDCYGRGHGTHVAGIAAGYGVTRDGHTYTGPYPPAFANSDFWIPPGVAPEAQLYALKVFGCGGSSDVVDLAIEWAVDPDGDGDFSDRVDVINLSLGATYGATYDSTTVAAENAAQLGVIVVAAAGNSGDTFYTVASPSVADHVLSVAAIGVDAFDAPAPTAALASFSARGPRRGDSALKPDLAAPGSQIFSAGIGTIGYSSSGTSMATPHVSGAMALLRQRYPAQGNGGLNRWTVEELKALVMNTAAVPVFQGFEPGSHQAAPSRLGAGRLDLQQAVRSQVVAYNGDNPGQVSVSFGAPEVLVSYTARKNIRLVNHSAVTATFTVSYTAALDMPGVSFELPLGREVVVPPAGVAVVPVGLEAEAAQMKHTRDPAVDLAQTFPRAWLSEEAGQVLFLPAQDGPILRVPVYAAPRPVAQMGTLEGNLSFTATQPVTDGLHLSGVALNGSQPPTDVRSQVSVLALQWSSPNEPPAHEEIPDSPPYDHADLKYVGVASNLAMLSGPFGQEGLPALEEPTLYFGIATHGDWSSPNEVQFQVYLDTDGDGASDYRLFNTNWATYQSDWAVSDVFLTVLEDLETGQRRSEVFLNGVSALGVDTAPYNTNVMVLPVRIGDLALPAQNPRLRYFVESYSLDISGAVALGRFVERTPTLSFDPSRPGLSPLGGHLGTILYDDVNGHVIPVLFSPVDAGAGRLEGILLLHHHNRQGIRAQVVTLDWLRQLYFPVIQSAP